MEYPRDRRMTSTESSCERKQKTQVSGKDGMDREPTNSVHLRDKELGEKVYKQSKKNSMRREPEGLVHPRDEQLSGSLLEMAEDSHSELGEHVLK